MRIWSFSAHLMMAAVAVALPVCVAAVVTADLTVQASIEREIDQALVSAADRLQAALAVVPPAAGQRGVERAVRDLVAGGELRGAVLLDAGRRVVVAEPTGLIRGEHALSSWPAAGRPREVTWSEGGVPLAARFVLLEGAGGAMRGAWTVIDRGAAEWPLRRARARMIGVVLAAFAAALAAAWLWSRVALRPLTAFSSSIARLAGGELTWRHPERGPLEIATLARRLNRLAEQLEASQTELTRSLSRENERTAGHARYLEQANRALLDLANRDPLTGLANRRRLELELERHIDLARESNQPLAVVMMDLDNFKRYNDSAGHLAGDELLRTVASTLRGRTRITDLVVRWGGDEFCILIPHTTPERALTAARSLVDAVAEATRSLPLPDSLAQPGVSAGVACFPVDGEDGTALVARADAALYSAKERGRGQALRFEGP